MFRRNHQPCSDPHRQHRYHQHRRRPSTLTILHLLSRLSISIRNPPCISAITNVTVTRIIIHRRRICTSSSTRNNTIIARIGIIYRISRHIQLFHSTTNIDTMHTSTNTNTLDSSSYFNNINYTYENHFMTNNTCTILYNTTRRRHRHNRIIRPQGHLTVRVDHIIYRPFIVICITYSPIDPSLYEHFIFIISLYDSLQNRTSLLVRLYRYRLGIAAANS